MIFGHHLRLMRTDANMTLADVASHIGVSIAYLSGVERGTKNPLNKDKLRCVLKLFGQENAYEWLASTAVDDRVSKTKERIRREYF